MMYEARAAALAAPEKPELAEEALQQIERQAGSALAEMRGLVYALRPKSLERDGLAVTLRDHAESLRRAHGIDINIRIEGVSPLPLEQETAIFRIAQEALQNASKHGAGAPVAVTLRQGRLGTELFVEDAGPGFDLTNPKRTVRTMGLSTMRDRAAAIGADLELSSRPGDRTAVHVFLPARSSRH